MSCYVERLLGTGLTEDEAGLVLEGRLPRPRWLKGDTVRVVPSGRNTERVGIVRLVRWHHRQKQWMYYIHQGGRPVTKRYWVCDLE